MKRAWLLAGVTVAALFAGPADAKGFKPSLPPPTSRLTAMDAPVNPFYGTLNPFYGNINPFYGKISPFWGDISPFWGTINPFYGTINPFYGPIDPFWGTISPFYGTINPFWGTIQPFWQDAGPRWGDLNTQWNDFQLAGASDYSAVQTGLQDFIVRTQSFWGARVQQQTDKNFMDGFGSAILAQYGIDPNNAASLANVTPERRSAFFLAWYDGLMNFSGQDHVDWWMASVHWSPSLTQTEAMDHFVKIGVLDSTIDHDDDSIEHLKFVGGFKSYSNGHGAAVASLISARHDGQGVMGIAPKSEVDLYNPFDTTGTASWTDVQSGINKLYAQGVRVVNMSLGVSGVVLSPEWASILGNGLTMNPNNIVFVKAAGNEGRVQPVDVMWTGLTVPQNLLLVGSVGPTNEISSFSNTPGEACITLLLGVCLEQNKLKYRYLVAPGELILVSDNAGGVVRMSGTSFAAPLVTGAVALIQTRWEWMQQHSAETVQIVLQSATDLGAPGVDPVYGWGLLNVEATQSPLDWNNLYVYQPVTYRDNLDFKTIGAKTWSPAALKAAILAPGQLDLWQQQKAVIVAFENIGTTYRDFTIPLSSFIVGKKMKINGATGFVQSYLYQRMIDWAAGTGFADFASTSRQIADGEWSLSMMATPSTEAERRSGDGPFHSEFVASNKVAGVTLRMGEGNGAHALAGTGMFSLATDFDPATGGINPILGFASGGAYAKGEVTLGEVRISAGFTNHSDDHTYLDPTYGEIRTVPLSPYVAAASTFGVDYTLTDTVTLNASYTRLAEANGVLGGQGRGALALNGGSTTQALTWGATVRFDRGWEFSGSATMARTGATEFDHSPLSIEGSGLASTAFEFTALKTGVFAENDRMRMSFAQPLRVENGSLRYTSLGVVDRETGELGPMVQHWNVADANREYRAEAIYAAPIIDGRAEVSGFALLNLNPSDLSGRSVDVSVGARLGFNF